MEGEFHQSEEWNHDCSRDGCELFRSDFNEDWHCGYSGDRPTTGTLYVVVRTKESGAYFQRLHALDITSGAEKFGGPVVIQASVAGSGAGSINGAITFNPLIQNQGRRCCFRTEWCTSRGDRIAIVGSYHGWLMAYDHASLAQKGVWVTTPNGSLGAIWESGTGPRAICRRMYISRSGTGHLMPILPGTDYGQSIMKLAPPSGGAFPVADYFTPYNGPNLNVGDYDIGSGGAMLLPDQTTGPHIHLLVQSDKVGNIYLVNRDNMGHYNSANNNQIVQCLPGANLGMWNSPTWWNNRVYFGAAGDVIKAFGLNTGTGLLNATPVTQTARAFAYPGTTTSVSANQDSNAILWALDNSTYKTTSGAALYAYDATNLATELYTSSQRSAVIIRAQR